MSEQQSPGLVFRFGPFELDVREKELRKHGTRVKLQGQPFLVLRRLLENGNRLVTREELRRELWPEDTFVDFEHSLNEAVNKVRFALGDSASKPRFVETVPRSGYRFIAPVEQAGGPPPLAKPSEAPRKRPRLPAALAAAIGLAAAGAWLFFRAAARDMDIHSLAVLPFENLSGDPAQEYFSDGMTDELTAQLATIDELRVISRTSARRYKTSDKTARQIGAELGVDALVEGSVRLADGKVRITVQLVAASSDRSLWTETYDGAASDILGIQDRVARSIARELRMELEARTRDIPPEAFHAYLKGRHHWNHRTEKGFLKAIEYFHEATSLAPGYAEAYAGLADTHGLLSVYNLQRPERAMPMAKEAALEALRLDENLAEAHASLGHILFLFDWNWAEAERELEKALELNPDYGSTYQWYGVFLMAMKRPEEGLRAFQQGLAYDPVSLSLNENLGWALYVARRYPEAIAQFEKTLELDPGFGPALRYLGLTQLYLGRHREALETLERARSALATSLEVQADLALAHALAGEKEEAQSMLDALMKESGERYVSPFLIASFHTGLGHFEEALEWLEKACDERVANMVFLGVDPAFDPLRSHPRFQALLARIGLSSRL
jgi:TolB-like protein/Tfp pilus assembly protein PilF/DNA-binding winged helix-turn-helix (wHTH) protein